MKKGNQSMDNRLKTIMDNYESMVVGLDDTFRFHCKMCGKCCTHREDIMLNPQDVYRIAKALNKAPAEIVTEYCDTYLGQSSRMVIVRLLPQGSVKRCPFLKDQKCSIHKSKPTVCALYPLGRSMKAVNDGRARIMEAQVEYICQMPTCGDTSETHSVREWLSEFGLLEDEEFFKRWMQLAADIGMNYSIDEPFFPQFLENDKKYRETMSKLLLEFGIPNRLNA